MPAGQCCKPQPQVCSNLKEATHERIQDKIQSHSASRCGAPALMLGCHVLLQLASRVHWGLPVPRVLFTIVALHLCPQTQQLQVALMLLLAVTVSDVLSPAASQSHSTATSAYLWARLLQGHTALPLS